MVMGLVGGMLMLMFMRGIMCTPLVLGDVGPIGTGAVQQLSVVVVVVAVVAAVDVDVDG